ncbi:hypothetical protein LMG28727_06932 [Paraburkholderia kirstenboschensis]|nr:hypothetical protein LMG28727_06932 [Paraburkholderia kirstenboschensis]
MRKTDRLQRIEEIQLALANAFESSKSPTVTTFDEGTTLYVQLSWVLESHGDTTLDARCVVTLRFSQTQIDSYAQMDTAKRLIVQQRVVATVTKRFGELQSPPARQGDCAFEVTVDDSLFKLPNDPWSTAGT